MSDDKPTDPAPEPTDEQPKAETTAEAPAEPAVLEPRAPEAAVGGAEETAPAAEPEPTPSPELAEVAALEQLHDQRDAEQPHSAPEPAPVEAHVAEPAADATEQPPEQPAEEAPEPEAPKKPARKSKKATKAAAPAAEEPAPAPAEEPTDAGAPGEAPAEGEAKPESKKKWYAVKVQSGREDTIKAAILRKVAIEGLEEYFGEIAIPTEDVIEKKQVRKKDPKTGDYRYEEKKVTKKKKKFHGYIFANVEFNDRILYLFRETSGVGDFLNVRGSPGNPIAEPMPEHEVQAMLTGISVKDPLKKPKVKIDFEKGDRVRIREGSFANQEGDVKIITEPKDPTDSPKITVTVTLWGRPVDVDVEHWQVEKV